MVDMPWGPIDRQKWREVPHMKGTLATEDDVRSGRAVFYLARTPHAAASPSSIPLPTPAILKPEDQNAPVVPVLVIQVEVADDMTIVGYRNLDGGNGICSLPEVQFVCEDDPRWAR